MTRKKLLRALDQQALGFAESGDASMVLEESATCQARQLAELIAGVGRIDVEAYMPLGWLYWCRFQALREGANQTDLAAALRLFSAVVQATPGTVPDSARWYPHPGRLDAP